MILDEVCYSDIRFGRVMLYVLGSPRVVSLSSFFPEEYLVISTSTFVSRYLQMPVSSFHCYVNNNNSFS